MPRRPPPIARVPLARSLTRLLAWPVLVAGTGAMAAATWVLGSFGAGMGGVVFAALGGVLMLMGLVAAIVLLSVRLDVEESAVRVSWIGGQRLYVLTRGPVTRVRLRGENASRLRPRLGLFGWALGSARLRDEEEINVVRLARTPTAIMVPTERGRLAIAPADEDLLLGALSRAARARQRLEDLAQQASAVGELEQPAPEGTGASVEPTSVDAAIEVEPHILTGIERALLEQRLGQEQAAAEIAAQVERTAALQAVATVTRAPAEAVAPAAAVEPGSEALPVPGVARQRRFTVGRPRPSAAFVLLPLVGAGAAWGVGIVYGTYPAPGTDLSRLTSLALVLAGPATSVGAIMALAWWPRLVGVVVAGGLAASVFIGQALVGP